MKNEHNVEKLVCISGVGETILVWLKQLKLFKLAMYICGPLVSSVWVMTHPPSDLATSLLGNNCG